VNTRNLDCIDAGSENCPCYLALTGDCLICSRLQGREECDCNWKGVCIFNEYIQGNGKVNNKRLDFTAEIAYKKKYSDDLMVLGLKVGKGFALKSQSPGSYIFLREVNSEFYYSTPICIMEADAEQGIIAVAIKIISAKTKSLADTDSKIIVRGVYRNGILGLESITSRSVKGKKILIITKGIGFAPGILVANYLWKENVVDFIIDKEKISEELICDYLGEGEGTIKFMSLNDDLHRKDLEDILIKEQHDIIILLTSDYFIETIGDFIKNNIPKKALAVANNFHICCGEGICGSCTTIDTVGNSMKMCKCNQVK
jgi:hypothetical protein